MDAAKPSNLPLTLSSSGERHAQNFGRLKAGDQARAHHVTGQKADDAGPPASFTWRIAGGRADAKAEKIAHALADLGHTVVLDGTGAQPDLVAILDPHPLTSDFGSLPAMLVGHDWNESGYPADWIERYNADLDGIGSASAYTTKVLIDHGVDLPIATIGLGVDDWDAIAADGDYAAPGKGFRFLHVSGCTRSDGVDLLLDAFARRFDRADDVSLLIRCTGGPSPELTKAVDRLQCANYDFPDVVIIDEDLTDNALKALYKQCQVFVSSSRAPGFGLSIASAMLVGVPAVVTAFGGHLDFCDDRNAWLVDYQFQPSETQRGLAVSVWTEPSPAALESQMWAAYCCGSTKRLQMGIASRRILLERFAWKHVAGRLDDLAGCIITNTQSAPVVAKLGWVTTWNVKCGIASYVGHLLSNTNPDELVIFADVSGERHSSDHQNVVRSWRQGKEGGNGLGNVLTEIETHGPEAIVIQFNYGFFIHSELNAFILALLNRGIIVFVELHSTVDPADHENWRLASIAEALSRCHRILAHGADDMNRLKRLGIVENVMLFPLGVASNRLGSRSLKEAGRQADYPPLVASFGFTFSNKGLLELVDAAWLLKERAVPVRLLMLNAEHPHPDSIRTAQMVRDSIKMRGMQAEIDYRTDYLDEDTCLAMLSEADLIVNPYQSTGESASSAVRYAMASGSPVLVTPLSIFDELGGAVFRSTGINPEQIAAGIECTLREIASGSGAATVVAESHRRWLQVHDMSLQSARLMRAARSIMRGMRRDRA